MRLLLRVVSLLALVVSSACIPRYAVLAEPVSLQSKLHYLDPEDRKRTRFGALEYLSGIEITSGHEAFGGYSGLIVSPDGTEIVAVSDAGHWLRAKLVFRDGILERVDPVGEIAPMLDETGRPFRRKNQSDAEAIVSLGDGSVLVSFERKHRVLRYPLQLAGFAATPLKLSLPAQLADAPANKGLELLAILPDGSLFALTERLLTEAGNTRGWLLRDGAETALSVRKTGIFEPTDLSILPNGDVLLLERRFTIIGGPGMRIRRIAAADLAQDSPLDGPALIELGSPYGIDNMEGLAVRRTGSGDYVLYLLSDDNFNPLQKTLLLTFLLRQQD